MFHKILTKHPPIGKLCVKACITFDISVAFEDSDTAAWPDFPPPRWVQRTSSGARLHGWQCRTRPTETVAVGSIEWGSAQHEWGILHQHLFFLMMCITLYNPLYPIKYSPSLWMFEKNKKNKTCWKKTQLCDSVAVGLLHLKSHLCWSVWSSPRLALSSCRQKDSVAHPLDAFNLQLSLRSPTIQTLSSKWRGNRSMKNAGESLASHYRSTYLYTTHSVAMITWLMTGRWMDNYRNGYSTIKTLDMIRDA
jgi:hypothetical protein